MWLERVFGDPFRCSVVGRIRCVATLVFTVDSRQYTKVSLSLPLLSFHKEKVFFFNEVALNSTMHIVCIGYFYISWEILPTTCQLQRGRNE